MIVSDKAVKKAIAKRIKLNEELTPFDISKILFDKQLDFVRDPSSNKVAMCSRRAGKTISCAVHLIDTAVKNQGVVCLYITLSRNNAKKIIWRDLKKINKDYKLGGKENLSELSITFPNGSIIYLSGAKDSSEIEKFRGLAIKLVYIDEAQSFRDFIRELINDVLSPALMDYAGDLCLTGTPAPIPVGFFHEVNLPESSWSKHNWSFWDNPFIIEKSKLTHQQMLERELKRRGVTKDDPSIQREWFGKEVLDTNSLLLRYNEKVNNFDELPTDFRNYHFIMGIDLGFDDADAIAILAWSENDPATYLIEEKVVAQQGLTELVNQIQDLQKIYPISKMVIDQGGLGKKLAEEMRRRHGIPVEAADKARKMENISFLNDALRTGRFKAKKSSKFAQDSYLVEIDQEKSSPDKIKVSTRYHSDIIDAVLYAFRESPAFSYEPPAPKPKKGTDEWAEQESSKMYEEALAYFSEQQEWKKYL